MQLRKSGKSIGIMEFAQYLLLKANIVQCIGHACATNMFDEI